LLNKLFDYEHCTKLILSGILDALEQSKDKIKEFPKHPVGTSTIKGMSLDIFPWHNLIQISFCSSTDLFEEKYIAEWKYFNFISNNSDNYCQSLDVASDYVSSFWDVSEEEELTDYYIDLQLKANVIFLAGAEALLDRKVHEKLISFGLDTLKYSEDPLKKDNFFLVFDDDKTIEANYCEIIKSNRATKLLFAELSDAKSF
jgi:hypothetical protein